MEANQSKTGTWYLYHQRAVLYQRLLGKWCSGRSKGSKKEETEIEIKREGLKDGKWIRIYSVMKLKKGNCVFIYTWELLQRFKQKTHKKIHAVCVRFFVIYIK